jgi:hypothetical protein|tara:strand:- start:178 stop:345 length:168 start_codon:yes stop_codon:yes gene_type:complete
MSGSTAVIEFAFTIKFKLAPVPEPISRISPSHLLAVSILYGITLFSTTEFKTSYH